MPLVIPGITNKDGGKNEDWASKLMGKKITDGPSDHISFAKKELPSKHRVLGENDMATMDYNPDRLNVHVDKDGTVRNVKWG